MHSGAHLEARADHLQQRLQEAEERNAAMEGALETEKQREADLHHQLQRDSKSCKKTVDSLEVLRRQVQEEERRCAELGHELEEQKRVTARMYEENTLLLGDLSIERQVCQRHAQHLEAQLLEAWERQDASTRNPIEAP